MASDGGSKFSYFLAGIGIGSILALLFAPRSGEETREFLRERTQDGRDYVKNKGAYFGTGPRSMQKREKKWRGDSASRWKPPWKPANAPTRTKSERCSQT